MKFYAIWVFILATLLAAGGHASDQAGEREPAPVKVQPSMNFGPDELIRLPDLRFASEFDGIDPKEADRFWDRWQLMTVRYRKDNGEQRFIYANDIAWSAIKSGATTYPDGAMIGKVATITVPDTLFPNSLAPGFNTRIQLMRKDSKKYAKHGGWGYAIYVKGIESQAEEESKVVEACHACHLIAEPRDYIFARPAYFYRVAPQEKGFEALFELTDASKLGQLPVEALDSVGHPHSGTIRALSMPLFTGSLSESVGPLSVFAEKINEIFLLIDEPKGYFLVAKPLPANKACNSLVRVVMKHSGKKGPILRKGEVCDGVAKWESQKKE